jgi:hypothetical protein
MFRFNQLNSKQFILSYRSNHQPQTTLLYAKPPYFQILFLMPFTPSMYKNILLADKLHIFSHINLFALDAIFYFIQLNSKQFIFSYRSNLTTTYNHKTARFLDFISIRSLNIVRCSHNNYRIVLMAMYKYRSN